MVSSSWFHHYLQTIVGFFTEHAVSIRRFIKRQFVTDYEGRVDVAPPDAFKQWAHVLMDVGLTHLKGKALRECRPDRKLVDQATVDTRYRYRSAFPARVNHLTQHQRPIRFEHQRLFRPVIKMFRTGAVRFHTDSIDACVGPAAAGHFLQRFENVALFAVDRFGATFLVGLPEARNNAIDRNYPFGSQHERAFQGQQTNRTASPNGDGVAGLNIAILGSHVARREN